ncbi:MAG: NUDIX domain-containing protein [Calditrichia bacterium]
MNAPLLTHRVAVIAYIIRDGRFLLLKRRTPPLLWAPPGGRLLPAENPSAGLLREVKEETALDVEVAAPVDVWFGDWEGAPLLSIDYLVRIKGGKLTLSSEHSDFAWLSLAELEKGKPVALHPEIGFTLQDFQKAARLHKLLKETL